MSECKCISCVFRIKCTPFEKLLQNADGKCESYIDVDNFDGNETYGAEDSWKEMSYHKYIDNLFDYVEDNID